MVSLVLVFIFTMFSTTAVAEADDSESLKLTVRQLVRQLDDPRLVLRDQAEEELIALDVTGLDFLPQPSERTSEEVRHRLARIRQTLERTIAERSLESTRVKLHGENLSLADVLTAIENQTHNRIELRDAPREAVTGVTVDFDAALFWSALDTVLDQTGMTVYHYNRPHVLEVLPAEPNRRARTGSASYAGPFRIEPISMAAQRDLRAGIHTLKLTLEIVWEPRLAPIALRLPLDRLTAMDNKGRSFEISDSKNVLPVELQGDVSAVQLSIPLLAPPRDVTRIARLRGTLLTLVPGRVETFRIEDLGKAKSVEQAHGNVTVRLEDVRQNNDGLWDVRIQVRYRDSAGALASHRGWIYRNQRFVLNKQGEPIEELAMELTAQGENSIGFSATYDLPEGPSAAAFVYKTPVLFVEMPIEFELKEIELP